MVKDSLGKDYILTNGAKDFHATLDGVYLIGKVLRVRSVSAIEGNNLIPNEYTYVLEIEKWMKSYSELSLLDKPEEDKRFVTLKHLFELPNSKCELMQRGQKTCGIPRWRLWMFCQGTWKTVSSTIMPWTTNWLLGEWNIRSQSIVLGFCWEMQVSLRTVFSKPFCLHTMIRVVISCRKWTSAASIAHLWRRSQKSMKREFTNGLSSRLWLIPSKWPSRAVRPRENWCIVSSDSIGDTFKYHYKISRTKCLVNFLR